MILLPFEQYHLLVEPLKKVTINHLFARSVIEKHVTGKVFVDDMDHPTTYYVIHPYGVSLLFGDCHNRDFNLKYRDYALNTDKTRNKFEWMQAFPREWDNVLKDLFGDKMINESDNTHKLESGIIEVNTRVNFKFSIDKYRQLQMPERQIGELIIRTGITEFTGMQGSVIPQYFWDNADDFMAKGMGFSLLVNGQIASTAYSAFVHDDKLEIGIETVAEFRGKGYAEKTSCSLIDYCLDNQLEPVWSCKLENTASVQLAQKLGFEPTMMFPFYRLSR